MIERSAFAVESSSRWAWSKPLGAQEIQIIRCYVRVWRMVDLSKLMVYFLYSKIIVSFIIYNLSTVKLLEK